MSINEHTRGGLLYRQSKALCKEHGTLQTITDFFRSDRNGNILQLECGCRRKEQMRESA